MVSRLAPGTAQFGLPYGIANQEKGNTCDETDAILGEAWSGEIDTLDTAISYGECEQLLGGIGVNQWQVITKLPEAPETCADVTSWVQDSAAGSLERLGVSQLCGLLLHYPQQLLGPHGDQLYRALVLVRDQGKVEKTGISVYGPDKLDAIWPS
jgi:aryl-alcohol dehydrogenase-like predicted oxidoreductase